jgi:hypothetical protein
MTFLNTFPQVIQKPGDIVFTRTGSFHQGSFSCGPNVGMALNLVFASMLDWMLFGPPCICDDRFILPISRVPLFLERGACYFEAWVKGELEFRNPDTGELELVQPPDLRELEAVFSIKRPKVVQDRIKLVRARKANPFIQVGPFVLNVFILFIFVILCPAVTSQLLYSCLNCSFQTPLNVPEWKGRAAGECFWWVDFLLGSICFSFYFVY